MNDDYANATPQQLREKADRCFRLAKDTTDQKAREALIAFGCELLDRADEIERRRPPLGLIGLR